MKLGRTFPTTWTHIASTASVSSAFLGRDWKMPREFYPDIDRTGLKPVSELCYNTIGMFDGPGICKRPKGHKVNNGPLSDAEELHQEEYEGWVWNDEHRIG